MTDPHITKQRFEHRLGELLFTPDTSLSPEERSVAALEHMARSIGRLTQAIEHISNVVSSPSFALDRSRLG